MQVTTKQNNQIPKITSASHLKKYLLIFLLGLLSFSCGSIRTDGVYQTNTKKEGYHHYVRFYQDSMVLTVSSTGEPHDLKKWFNQEKEDVSKGTFTVKNDSIFFNTKSPDGIVAYKGRVRRNKMVLHFESKINGFTSIKKYHFERF